MKNRKLSAKICSLVLALALALCCLPTAIAAENEITVDFSFYDGAIVIPKSEITVYDGIAEEYGYEVQSADHNKIATDAPTVFDVIVAAHEAYYGDDFTKETAKNYLAMSGSFMTKAFGISTSNLGFCVNDKVANDGIYNESYYSYTSYSCDTAKISDGDYISFYTYKSSYWADYYITPSASEIEAVSGEEFTFSVSGYSVVYYGSSTEETIKANTAAMKGLDVYATTDFEAYTKVGTLDENGEITLSFEELGTVYLCISGSYNDAYMGACPVVANWVEVTVTEPDGAVYLTKGFDISLNENEASVTFNFSLTYFDIMGKGPDKTENFSYEITCPLIVSILKIFASIF